MIASEEEGTGAYGGHHPGMAATATTLATLDAVATTPMPASGELSCLIAHLGECDFLDAATGLRWMWPRDWPVQRLRIVTETGPPASAHQLDAVRWISLEYVPSDPAQPQVPLFDVAVLPRDQWIRQSAKNTRLVTGTEVASSKAGRVAVATLPAVNPYPSGSRDADIYDALQPDMREISLMVQFLESH
jgi:hypothetical protein